MEASTHSQTKQPAPGEGKRLDKASVVSSAVTAFLLAVLCFSIVRLLAFGLLYEGAQALISGHGDRGASAFSFVIDHLQPEPHAYFLRALAYAANDRWLEAQEDLNHALAHGESRVRVLLTRAAFDTEAKSYENAVARLVEAIALDPNCAEAYKLRAVVRIRMGAYSLCVADCDQALPMCSDPPSKAKLYQVRASANLKLGRVDDAIRDYSRAIDIHADNALLLCRAGAYIEAGFYDLALKDCADVLKSAPDSAPAWLNRGICMARMGLAKDARRDFSRAITLDGSMIKAFAQRGLLSVSQHDWRSAVADLNQAIKMGSDSPEVNEQLQIALRNIRN